MDETCKHKSLTVKDVSLPLGTPLYQAVCKSCGATGPRTSKNRGAKKLFRAQCKPLRWEKLDEVPERWKHVIKIVK